MRAPVASTSARVASAPSAGRSVLKSFSGMRVQGSVGNATACFQAKAAPAPLAAARMVTESRTKEAGIGIFGNKAGMTQIFDAEGLAVPVTVIAVQEGNVVTMVKSPETDGYSSVQIGYKVVTEKKLTKPELGHLAKAGLPPMRYLAEFKIDNAAEYNVGQEIKAEEIFSEGDLVDVQGTSIGKGFQGSIKRWGMRRGLMSHGSKSHRQHGSIGPGTTPGRIYPGGKHAGRMGGDTVKVRKLEVVKVDGEKRCLVVKGAVPGKPGNLLRITPAKIVGKNI